LPEQTDPCPFSQSQPEKIYFSPRSKIVSIIYKLCNLPYSSFSQLHLLHFNRARPGLLTPWRAFLFLQRRRFRLYLDPKESTTMSESSYRRALEQEKAQQAAQAAADAATAESSMFAQQTPTGSPETMFAQQTPTDAVPQHGTTCTSSPETISEARLAANRANAQHSTGPRTEEGKAKVCLNAVKTGLTGRTVLLSEDEAAPYQELLREYEKALQPVGVEERALVQSIVDGRWRLDRIPGLEMALVTLIKNEWIARDPIYAAPARSILTEMKIRREHAKEFRNLAIQEARLARRREKEMAELLRLQQARKAKEAEALAQAAKARLLAAHQNKPFDLASLGFEFSTQQFESYFAALTQARKQQMLQEALKGNAETTLAEPAPTGRPETTPAAA
jgi:hypothetical protein